MDSDQGKLFIGGISWETNEDKLKEYFSQYGDVLQTAVMRDKTTGRPRGFGFVVFSEPEVLDKVLQDKHTIDGRTVEAKKALSREEQQTNVRSGISIVPRSTGGNGNIRTKKIFVGGLPSTLTEEEFRQYFETYGSVTDVVVMYDQNTQRPRGFGFVSFDSEEAVDRVLHRTFHDLSGKRVEVKRALPKDANPSGGNRTMGSGAGVAGGSYQGYGGSAGNGNSFEGRMDSSRYMQPHGSASGFPTYGSSAYSSPGFGYGPANGAIGYTGYGAYGGPSAGAYGNPNVPTPVFGAGPQGGARAPWGSQSSGFGAMGYGSTAPWGATAAGAGAIGGGPVSIPSGQSPGAVLGYGGQGYGYGGYVGAEGGYSGIGGRYSPSTGARGPGVGEMQGSSVGYMGGGYGDVNGNTVWRSDSLHASNGLHGTHRQAQQQ